MPDYAKKLTVAIDGPAGAGKSTVARLAAERLGCAYIDTGAMYRAIAYKVLQTAKNKDNIAEDEILAVLKTIDVDLRYENARTTVFANGEDVTDKIRTPEVSRFVSKVAALAPVRQKMTALQKKMGARGGVLMDGRDIATNVLPHADVKIFLTASVKERAQRRYKELCEKGLNVSIDGIEKEIAARDKQDTERKISPLVRAKDAVLLDTTSLTIEEAVAKVLALCEGRN